MVVVAGLYVLLWQPVRAGLMQYAAVPALSAVGTGQQVVYEGRTVHLQPVDAEAPATPPFEAPPGVKLLLPVLFIAALFPRRLFWIGFWSGHLVLWGVGLAVLMLGLRGASWGFVTYHFIASYAVDVYSLSVPALLLLARSERPEQDPKEKEEEALDAPTS